MCTCILNDCAADASQGTLLPVYAGLIALLHFCEGTGTGDKFLELWKIRCGDFFNTDQKEAYVNSVKLLGYLYNYEAIHCSLLFHFIRESISRFQETDIEALLAILKITGLELRSDDPTALKDIINELQERVKQVEEEKQKDIGEEYGIRIKFMLEMIYDLKNNKGNTSFTTASAPENIVLLAKKAKKDSPSLEKSLNANPQITSQQNKLLKLAKKQGMNTDVRRAIFIAILGAEDYLDAFESIVNLELKGKQDREVINVLIHCCAQVSINYYFYVCFCRY